MNHKLPLAVLLLVLIAAVIAGITVLRSKTEDTADSAADTMSEVQNETEIIIVPSEMPQRISMDVPVGFTETSSPYYDKYYILDDASIIVTGEELTIYGTDLETYANDVKIQYSNTADRYSLLSEENAEINGVPCKILEFTYAIVGTEATQNMKCTTAIFLKDNESFLLTCKSHSDTYMRYRELFRKMIESVEISAKAPDDKFASATTETIPEIKNTPETEVSVALP